MHYTINVGKYDETTKRYLHLFATADHSIPDMSTLKRVYAEISDRFPCYAFGPYKVTVTQWMNQGTDIDPMTLTA